MGATCLTVSRGANTTSGYINAQYKYQSCADVNTGTTCMYPGVCPRGFTRYSECFKMVNISGGVVEAVAACSSQSSFVAFPESIRSMKNLADMVRNTLPVTTTVNAGTMDAIIGLNSVTGNWTLGGAFSPLAEVTNLALGPDPFYALRIPLTPGSTPTLVSFPIERNNFTVALCQFPGVEAFQCVKEQPPSPQGANMTRIWNNGTSPGTVITYRCLPGYFLGNDTLEDVQEVFCLGQFGGWYPSVLQPCLRAECNVTDLPDWSNVSTNQSANYTYLNGTVTYTCPPTMTTFSNLTQQVTTCSIQNTSQPFFSYLPAPAPCDRCATEPLVENATTTWSASTTWQVNDTLNATCNANHTFNLTTSTLDFSCTPLGWEILAGCYPACTTKPPEITLGGLKLSAFTNNSVGTELIYTCPQNTYMPPTQVSSTPDTEIIVNCTTEMTWAPNISTYTCVQMCLSDPLSPPVGATSDWNNFTRSVGTEVNVTCSDGMKFADLNESVIVRCENDGNWTSVDPTLLTCRAEITVPPPSLPVGVTSMLVTSADGTVMSGTYTGPYWSGMSLNFSCPQGTMAPDGRTYTTVTESGGAWSTLDPTFECLNVCSTSPPSTSGSLQSNYSGFAVEGTTVGYWCVSGEFVSNATTIISVCQAGNWTVSILPGCTSK
ncbi:sushi, von Willebrand factor type A, EGF and pentraxin domain-containing protein 1-like [Cherax quadricarinatus]|uniref:sushi, von Willebrand factor type A, EGF and pentraxin domain-containing protein 1-like n=1 Tax=Cherax quadricarinatus TaxID=27406 RepID=UPI00387E6DA3